MQDMFTGDTVNELMNLAKRVDPKAPDYTADDLAKLVEGAGVSTPIKFTVNRMPAELCEAWIQDGQVCIDLEVRS